MAAVAPAGVLSAADGTPAEHPRAVSRASTVPAPTAAYSSHAATGLTSSRPGTPRSASYLASLDKLVNAGLPRFGAGVIFGTSGGKPELSSQGASSQLHTAQSLPSLSVEATAAAASNGDVSGLTRQRSGASSAAAARARARNRLRAPVSFADFHQLLAVEHAFVRGRPLVATGRVLLRQGRMLKEATGRAPAMRKFYLFSDVLVYGTPIRAGGRQASALPVPRAVHDTPNGEATLISVSPLSTTPVSVASTGAVDAPMGSTLTIEMPGGSSVLSASPGMLSPAAQLAREGSFATTDSALDCLTPPSNALSAAQSAESLSTAFTQAGESTCSATTGVSDGVLASVCTPSLERQIIVSLGHLTVTAADDDDRALCVTTGKESFRTIARDVTEREAWRHAFADALQRYREAQARRARDHAQDPTAVVRRVGRLPTNRVSRTMDDGFRRSWTASSSSGVAGVTAGAGLSAMHSIGHGGGSGGTVGVHMPHAATYSHPAGGGGAGAYADGDGASIDAGDTSSIYSHGDRTSAVYDTLRFWQVPRSLQRKDSMSSDISRRSDVDGVEWVPDEAVEVCMVCKRTRFSMIVRKHHCRRCGYVICWNCSEMRRSTLQPERKVRTCVDCVAVCDGTGWMTVEDRDGGSPPRMLPSAPPPSMAINTPAANTNVTKVCANTAETARIVDVAEKGSPGGHCASEPADALSADAVGPKTDALPADAAGNFKAGTPPCSAPPASA
ncbi:hypothetical protein THASP1DRAFT_27088 [Thamnocephalis sphaerospora]|uniref:FYVE-type domain-containing protein n=1 Tax=Thamnocephalis sphaerospora TaxID=78915 RepID=A0A4P9XZI3_9FUNG|nr:hypothetical protein THASP1DRAFT_27088 [Thamnocephalis sphaerospora]|eukprot:RKP11171.1 hypothetical protein THASP1DRAFT_27088 [Thamnocephalis sphaerospora]